MVCMHTAHPTLVICSDACCSCYLEDQDLTTLRQTPAVLPAVVWLPNAFAGTCLHAVEPLICVVMCKISIKCVEHAEHAG